MPNFRFRALARKACYAADNSWHASVLRPCLVCPRSPKSPAVAQQQRPRLRFTLSPHRPLLQKGHSSDFLLSVFKASEFSRIPNAADFAVCGRHRLRNPIGGAVVQAQAESDPPRNC